MRRTLIAFVIMVVGLLPIACTQPSGGAGPTQGATTDPAAPASAEPVKPGY